VETQRWLDRLARDHPELLDLVYEGKLKPYTAALKAGIVKEGPLGNLMYWWGKASPEERAAFLVAIGAGAEPARDNSRSP
jgi:hypothetical protein